MTQKTFAFAKKHSMPFYFVSAADGTNVVKVRIFGVWKCSVFTYINIYIYIYIYMYLFVTLLTYKNHKAICTVNISARSSILDGLVQYLDCSLKFSIAVLPQSMLVNLCVGWTGHHCVVVRVCTV